ncbi:hypothetical protein ABZR88_12335 [Mucilaginibacter yixingensis]|nr:hypothetical protein [Mucilaginibacter yixingensis]
MKNPFEKQDKAILIGAIAAGAALAGGLTWLLLTEDGNEKRERWKEWMEEKAKNMIAGCLSCKTGVDKDVAKGATDAVID